MRTGERIRYYRNLRKLTQEEMAAALNISQRAYSKIENDEVQIKLDRLDEIARLLNVEINNLLSTGGNQSFENVTQSQIAQSQIINQNGNEKERELYEKIIDRQQEEINYLKGLLSVLNK